ncbi:DUF3025 domain-containing protein [Bowmanella dokdonensis]|uniref:DUF3025 domain-containing protein n=1 Tax=Bowmanella dokdonensis TaxID=751969 RepID=A0A939DRX4_9ALTE|nr:DUF3025 domain-containing protein [Bowmanella dokdonensis]MBN7827558.1 DUF3025 domain-containing protein [Bowmanella dokdonensis]
MTSQSPSHLSPPVSPSPRRFADTLPDHWQTGCFEREPFAQLDRLFSLSSLSDWPDSIWLNADESLPVDFIAQDALDMGQYSYEEFIGATSQVPTRQRNWHDLFNALVWRQFPLSKAALNRLHLCDIAEFGVRQRTPRRDRITHFDECGVVLAYADPAVPDALARHEWQQAFVNHRTAWGSRVKAFVFGHANYEMLLNPYIGLTGKWLGIKVKDNFFAADLTRQLTELDESLADKLENQDCLATRGQLFPLPLLGVPLWWPENQDPAFYNNTGYFMPRDGRYAGLVGNR